MCILSHPLELLWSESINYSQNKELIVRYRVIAVEIAGRYSQSRN